MLQGRSGTAYLSNSQLTGNTVLALVMYAMLDFHGSSTAWQGSTAKFCLPH